MSSFNRQHDGRSRPPPDRNRPGYHPPSSTVPQHVDPHYLQYLRTQAEQINQQLKELTQNRGSQHYDHYQPRTNVRPMAPAQVSIPSSSHRPRPKTHRNPTREKSKWQFYAVKNGLNGDDVFSSWGQAHPYCWDPTTEYFFPGSLCKGFDETIDTYDYNTIIKPSSRSQIPMKVQLQTSSTDNTISTDSANPTPFLSAASNKALPKYSAKPKNDINKFIYNFESF